MPKAFKGVVGTPVTPFTPDNRVDFATFERQVNFLITMGVHVLAHPMNIGEAPNLSVDERRELARRLVEAAAGRVPVLIHVSAAGTDQVVELSRYSQEVGAAGVVAMPPYHWKPGRAALVDHFLTVGSSIEIVLLAYNNPPAVQVEIGSDVLAELIDHLPNCAGMKDASYNIKYFTEVCRVTSVAQPGFAVFTGTEYLLPSMAVGGAGTFCACAEVAPRLVRDLYEACDKEEYARARPLQYKVEQLLKILMVNYPATIKYAMELMGRPVGQTRKPILPLTDEAKVRAREGLRKLGILEQEPHGW